MSGGQGYTLAGPPGGRQQERGHAGPRGHGGEEIRGKQDACLVPAMFLSCMSHFPDSKAHVIRHPQGHFQLFLLPFLSGSARPVLLRGPSPCWSPSQCV